MEELIPTIIVVIIFGAMVLRGQRTALEQRYVLFSLVAHLFSVVGSIAVADWGEGGDLVGYLYVGRMLARAIRADFAQFAPRVIGLFFHSDDAMFGDDFAGVGSSTGSMKAISALLMLLVNDSTYAASTLITIPAFFGKLALYRVFRDAYAEQYRPRLLIATMLLPSVVFWSSGLVKEGIAMSTLGWIILGIQEMWRGRVTKGILMIAVPVTILAMIKAYVLFPLLIGAGVWFYRQRAKENPEGVPLLKPIYLIMGILAAIGGVIALGSLFPDYAVEGLAQRTAQFQEVGETLEAGSNYTLGGDGSERSFGGQIAFAPLALATALFRPFVFEAHNAAAAAAALEMLVMLWLLLQTVWSRSFAQTVAEIWDSPMMVFSCVFVVLFGTVVGLATTNLGTLSRYRLPLMPFYAATLLVLHKGRNRVVTGDTLGEGLETSDEEESDRGVSVAARPPRAAALARRP
jgi:hypothetical protein